MKNLMTVVLFGIVLIGCNQKKTEVKTSTTTADVKDDASISSPLSLEKLWELDGFSMPESVLAPRNHDWIYVSNVNGKEPGFISRLTKDGKIDDLKWASNLDGPTGMGIFNNQLFTGSGSRVDVIDLSTGKLIKSIVSEEATTLNDIAISPDGQVFVSNVVDGGIYTIVKDEIVLFIKDDKIAHPNGLLFSGSYLYVGDYGGGLDPDFKADAYGSLYRINMLDKSLELVKNGEKLGGLDGVTNLDNTVIASSNPTGKVFGIAKDGHFTIGEFTKGVADIDIKETTLFAPNIFENKVRAFAIKGGNDWQRIMTKQEYMDKAANVFFGDEGGQSVATKSGKIFGIFGGEELSGTWEWKDDYFCRTSTLGTMDLGLDCLVIEVTDTKMRLTLEKGNGIQVVYDRKD